jgi:predicted nucleic acid-binding protein
VKKLLVDTNIVIDLLSKREKFYNEAAELFSRADRKEFNLTISTLTFANTNYILAKLKTPKEAREILRRFKLLVELLNLDARITELALCDDNFKDIEDGLQYYSAIENKIDVIITRNKKDFKHSTIPFLTAREFLDRI